MRLMDIQVHCTSEDEVDCVFKYYCDHGYRNNIKELGSTYKYLPDKWIQTWPNGRTFTHGDIHYPSDYIFDGEFADWCVYVGIEPPQSVAVDVSDFL